MWPTRRQIGSTRLAYIEILGQLRQPKAVPVLKTLLASSSSHAIKRVALEALMNYDDPTIGQVVLRQYHSTLPDEQRPKYRPSPAGEPEELRRSRS